MADRNNIIPNSRSRENRFIDAQWSKSAPHSRGIFEYYDYYYTGDNVRVYMDGVSPPDVDANIPMMEFAFKITQQKAPVYGFWSYTYDQMMRGSRIVQGAFRVATKNTNYMTRIIAKSAQARANKQTDTVIRKLDVDEKNIDTYWTRHSGLEYEANVEQNVFSIHPPFNFIVVYGIDDMSTCFPFGGKLDQYVSDKYNDGFGMMSNDDNHTLTEADQENNVMRRIIESVEITDMQVEYGANNQVCAELYTFIARDSYSPIPASTHRSNRDTYVPSASELDYQTPNEITF
jgi:hypothetical protein